MSDEKKLPDEAVKDVSGGGEVPLSVIFEGTLCKNCCRSPKKDNNCPYCDSTGNRDIDRAIAECRAGLMCRYMVPF